MTTGEGEWGLARHLAASQPACIALGVHPWHVHEQTLGWEGRLLEALVASPHAAVGEAGLDRARLDSSFDLQLAAFLTQLRFAQDLSRPLVVHCVRSDGKLLDLLRAEAALPPVVIMHAFGGSPETAAALLRLGGQAACKVYFGFSPGALRLRRADAVIRSVPADRLLLESDAHVGAAAIAGVAESCDRLAAARGWTPAETEERCARNAHEAFDRPDPAAGHVELM